MPWPNNHVRPWPNNVFRPNGEGEGSRRVTCARFPVLGSRPSRQSVGAVGYLVVAMLLSATSAGLVLAQDAVRNYEVSGDAIVAALTDRPGDPAAGRAIVANRQVGLCLLCHSGPFPEERFQGDLAPDLRGAGKRWTAGQLRLRLVDSTRVKPDTIMPPFHRTTDLARVAPALRGKPILSAQQIEDVLAYLMTLRDDP